MICYNTCLYDCAFFPPKKIGKATGHRYRLACVVFCFFLLFRLTSMNLCVYLCRKHIFFYFLVFFVQHLGSLFVNILDGIPLLSSILYKKLYFLFKLCGWIMSCNKCCVIAIESFDFLMRTINRVKLFIFHETLLTSTNIIHTNN